MGHRLRQLGSFGRVGIRGQPHSWPTKRQVGDAPITFLGSVLVTATPTQFTPPDGTDFLLVIPMAAGTGADNAATAMEWGGTPMTAIPAARSDAAFNSCAAFYLVAPAPGPLNLTFSGHSGTHRAEVYFLQNVNPITPIRDAAAVGAIDVTQITVSGVDSSPADFLAGGGCSTAGQTPTISGDMFGIASVAGFAWGQGVDDVSASVTYNVGINVRMAGNLVSLIVA